MTTHRSLPEHNAEVALLLKQISPQCNISSNSMFLPSNLENTIFLKL